MSDIDAVFNDDDFFMETDKPSQQKQLTPKPEFTPIAEGEYFGHLVDIEKREVSTHGGKHKADVINFRVKVHEDNSINNYTYEWGNTIYKADGSEYVGKVIRANGIFKYLVPSEGDTFEANPNGNKGYSMFCESIGINLPIIEKEINGETIKVKSLPVLTKKDIEGQPVIGVVGIGKSYTNKKGKEVVPKIVKFVKSWRNGTRLTETSDEASIPF